MLRREDIRGMTEDQWGRLRDYVADDRDRLMPHALAQAVGIDLAQAMAVLDRLAAAEDVKLYAQFYHECPEIVGPFRVAPLERLPDFPIECAECHRLVAEGDLTAVETMAKIVRAPEIE